MNYIESCLTLLVYDVIYEEKTAFLQKYDNLVQTMDRMVRDWVLHATGIHTTCFQKNTYCWLVIWHLRPQTYLYNRFMIVSHRFKLVAYRIQCQSILLKLFDMFTVFSI
jgi:hypothetical protein